MSNKKYLVQKKGKTVEILSKYEVCTKYDIDRPTFSVMLDKGVEINGITIDLKFDEIDYNMVNANV